MVYSSWCENCPNILLESMGCSCPVVAMNIGPMPEICGESGYFATPLNGKSLAKAMKRSLEKSSNMEKRKLAKNRASKFTWKRAFEDHLKVFKSVYKSQN